MGVSHIDNILMILGISLNMTKDEQKIVTREMMKGFNDQAQLAGTEITGGQSVMNLWPMIGGEANAVCHSDEIIIPNSAQEGDILLLTKPLGTQVAVNIQQWKSEQDPKYKRVLDLMSELDVDVAYHQACISMKQLNKNAASLMKKYQVRGSTDITGFGLIGHLENLVEAQKNPNLLFEVNTLPVIPKMHLAESIIDFKLQQGYSAETSGGLCMMVPPSQVDSLQTELLNEFGEKSWVIGEIKHGQGEAKLHRDTKVSEVTM